MELVTEIYQATGSFPKEEMFGLTSQIRRAAVSVAANIVEGQSRSSKKEFTQFLRVANGSLVEVEYYIGLTKDLGYITETDYTLLFELCTRIKMMLYKLIKSLAA